MLFNEREMSLALAKLFELFSPSDYEAFDEEEIGYAGGLCLPEVCMALKDAVQTVYQYSVTGGYEKSFDYRGVELFNQRGCLILSDVEQMVFDEAETTYATELWLLEDMSFATPMRVQQPLLRKRQKPWKLSLKRPKIRLPRNFPTP